MKERKTIILFFVYLTFIAVLPNIELYQIEGKKVTVVNENLKISVNVPNYSINKINEKIEQWEHATDYITTYRVENYGKVFFEYSIINRKIDGGGFLFIEVDKINNFYSDKDVEFSVVTDNNQTYKWNDLSKDKISMDHNDTIGVDLVQGPIGYMEQTNFSFLLGRGVSSEPEVKHYDNGTSKLRDLHSQVQDFDISDDLSNITFQWNPEFSAHNEKFEWWLMYSNDDRLLTDQKMSDMLADLNNNFSNFPKWLTSSGNIVKLPWSVEPFDEHAYGRNIGRQFRGYNLHSYILKKSKYDYLNILNMLTSLEKMKSNYGDNPILPTEYTSSWLKRSYGIYAPYFDTRHNEGLGLFYLTVSNELSFDYMDEFYAYADFLVEKSKTAELINVGEYYLLPDYFGPGLDGPTHTSLNHALGEIYYLLQAYFNSGDEKYLNLAYTLRRAIEELGEKWINPAANGDLYYQVDASLNFSGTDYNCLTLKDLINNQDAWVKTEFGTSEMFYHLIESKRQSGVCKQF